LTYIKECSQLTDFKEGMFGHLEMHAKKTVESLNLIFSSHRYGWVQTALTDSSHFMFLHGELCMWENKGYDQISIIHWSQ